AGQGGDITAVGGVASGAAFATGSGNGTGLFFFDADGEGQLTVGDLTDDRTYTLPDASGEVTLLGQNIDLASAEVTGTLGIGNGGTGVTGTPTNGQLLIGNGAGYTLATLGEGEGIDIANASGSITIAG